VIRVQEALSPIPFRRVLALVGLYGLTSAAAGAAGPAAPPPPGTRAKPARSTIRLLGIAVRPVRVQAGQRPVLLVRLNRPAGRGGTTIYLQCNQPKWARLPRRLRIPEGERSLELSFVLSRKPPAGAGRETRVLLRAWDEITEGRLAAGQKPSTATSRDPVFAPVRQAVLIVRREGA